MTHRLLLRQRARRYLTREERAELAAAREEHLRAVAASRVLELMLAEGPAVNAIRARNARDLLGTYGTRDLRAR